MTRGKKVFTTILIIAIIVIAVVAYVRAQGGGNVFMIGDSGSASDYQAVFLTNSQVYFGKLSGANSQFSTLRDIYYLQVQNQSGGAVTSNDISLVKLGNELHGPLDEMKINRDHILIIEDLREDSNVVDAIRRYKEEQQ